MTQTFYFQFMTVRFITLFSCMLFAATLSAQFRGGVKTGLNFSTLKGTPETDANGAALESVKNFTGFHIGPTFSYGFTDQAGIRGELLYSKKGAKYTYTGPGSRTFVLENNLGKVATTGTSTVQVAVTHVGLDIPVTAYYRLGDFEISGGVYGSLILQKVGDGALQYSWDKQTGTIGGSFESFLDYNFNKDELGESKGETFQEVIIQQDPDGFNKRISKLPQTFGAYYDYPEDRGNLYKSFDYGVIGGLTYYLSRSLFIGGRVQYGLADLTNNNADFGFQNLNQSSTAATRNDKDYNFTIQASVGFSF